MILVTGATGAQGGATARALLAAGAEVRIATRDPGSPAAVALVQAGASAAAVDFDDARSVRAALIGADAVFSMQTVGPSEIEQGLTLINEATRAGVQRFVHTSVTGTADHISFPEWGAGRWAEDYWVAKWTVENAVRSAGFVGHTVLRPAFMMENFVAPKVHHMFPRLRYGEIAGVLRADAVLQLISADDIGRFAAAALMQPERFDRHTIDLAAESPTVSQIAATLAAALSTPVRVVEQSPEDAVAGGLFPGWVRAQEWINEVGYRARISELSQYQLSLTTFSAWIATHRTSFSTSEEHS